MAERTAVVLDEDGTVVNVIVLPAKDSALGPAWMGERRQSLRELTAEDQTQGVGVGWKRAKNGRLVDERPKPEPSDTPSP